MTNTTGKDATSFVENAVLEKVTREVPTDQIAPGVGMIGRNVAGQGRITGTIGHLHGTVATRLPAKDHQ